MVVLSNKVKRLLLLGREGSSTATGTHILAHCQPDARSPRIGSGKRSGWSPYRQRNAKARVAEILLHPLAFPPRGAYLPRKSGSGLYGFGRIVQENPDAPILVIEHSDDVRIRDLTLERPPGAWGKSARAVDAKKCDFLWLENLKIHNNRSVVAAVQIEDSKYCRIQGCEILNYKSIHVDDRVDNDLYGYAFNCINGHGIMIIGCDATHLIRNRILEQKLLPTKQVMDDFDLGTIVKSRERLGPLASYGVEDGFVVIWHQGAGVRVTAKGNTHFTLIDGNYIEHAAQGLDLHADHVIVTNNHVTDAYTGMKAMHGSRNVVISNNIFQAPGKYGILLRPGSASGYGDTEHSANVQRAIIVANNIITDQGYGSESWRLWNARPELSYPVGIKLGYGPLSRNPPMEDVVIEGNIVHDRGRDRAGDESAPGGAGPRYKYAVWFDEQVSPNICHFKGNVFHPGSAGVSNKPLSP